MTELINEPNHIMVLKAIDELRFKVGKKFLVDHLLGEKTDKIRQHKLYNNKYFGCLGGFTRYEIQSLLNELEFKRLIEVKKPDPTKFYSVVCLTRDGEKKIIDGKSDIPKRRMQSCIESISDEDRKLFSLFGNFLDGLNDFQKKAVIEPSKHILCVAGAGTGKTKVLTKRVEFLSRLKNVPDDKILAITFTRKARKEMIKRLENIIPQNKLNIETFNSFCEKMLKKYSHLIYDKNYKVLDFKNRILLVNHIVKELGYTPESATDLYYSHRRYISEDKKTLYLRFINDLFAVMDHYRNMEKEFIDLKNVVNDIEPSDRNVGEFVLKVIEKIIYYKQKLGYRDYTDQIVHTMELFSKFPECIPKFEYILVDEYQDVNNMQIKLLDYLKPENLFAVGDPRQSIFGWRGSNIQHIIQFTEKYPDCKLLELKINYRSKEDIIKVLNSVILPMKLPEIGCCDNKKSSERNVLMLEHGNEEAEHLFVAQSIQSLEIKKNEIFVLGRTNKQLEKISETLRKFNIDFIKKTIEDQKSNIEPKDSQITLSTIHAIKGLEAEVVYLIGANNFNFPCKVSEHPILDILKTNDSYDKYEEELRVFYVALSRAKSKLIINYYSTPTNFIDERTRELINKHDKQEDALNNNKNKENRNRLFDALKRWRLEKAKESKVLAFQIFSDRTLIEICQNRPTTIEELHDIYGIGPSKVSRFGEDLLKIVFEN